MYDLLKWLHILSAVAALGSNMTYPFWLRLAGRDPKKTPFAVAGIASVDRRLANAGYSLLLLSGIAMVIVGGIPWNTPWLELSIGLYVLTFLVAMFFYAPAIRAQQEHAGNPQSLDYEAAEERANRWGVAIIMIVIAIVYVMSAKPVLWG